MNEHVLLGCREIPLSNYLKAMGIFTILARKNPDTRAFWKDGVFVLQSSMDRGQIVSFIVNDYTPAPVLNPLSWSKYETSVTSIRKMLDSEFGNRLKPYKKMLERMDTVSREFMAIYKLKKITKEDIDKKTKPTLLKLCRNWLPDEVIPLLDAVAVAGEKSCIFAPIAGSGMNDGNHDMAENFIKHIEILFGPKAKKKSAEWLEMSLYDDGLEPLMDKTSVMHNANGTGGPNSGANFEGISVTNPWDYILMIEGLMLFAGNVSRRASTSMTGKVVFPFTMNTSNAGYPTASNEEKNDSTTSRGEIWVPVWANSATYREVKHVFGEGRAQFGGRHARTGSEFARAVVTLGTERRISQFRRFCIMKRKGKAYLTINAGKINVRNVPAAGLFEDVDEWYERLERDSSKNTAALNVLIKNYNDSMIKFCSFGKKIQLQQVLICIGKLEKYASISGGGKPLKYLRAEWVRECYDNTAEFRLAASLASICDGKTGNIRANLEDITYDKFGPKYEKTPSCVWNEKAGTLKNMVRVLHRRCVDGKIDGWDTAPIRGRIHAERGDIRKFLYGELDEKKIGDLMLPLSMVNMREIDGDLWGKREADTVPLPEAYSVIKALYPSEKSENIPFEMSVLNSLIAGRIDNAYAKAAYILHAHGMQPSRHSKKNGLPKSTTVSDTVGRRLAASLLFPVSDFDRRTNIDDVTIQAEE